MSPVPAPFPIPPPPGWTIRSQIPHATVFADGNRVISVATLFPPRPEQRERAWAVLGQELARDGWTVWGGRPRPGGDLAFELRRPDRTGRVVLRTLERPGVPPLLVVVRMEAPDGGAWMDSLEGWVRSLGG